MQETGSKDLAHPHVVHIEGVALWQDADTGLADQVGQEVFVSVLLAHDGATDRSLDIFGIAGVLDLADGQGLEGFQGLGQSELVSLGDLGGLETQADQIFGLTQKSTAEDDDKIGTVSDLEGNYYKKK